MSDPRPLSRPLEVRPCQSICVWTATDEVLVQAEHGPITVFSCRGCGTEWVRSEPWTPVDADGVVPAGVAAEKRRDLTTAPDEDAADSGDTCTRSGS